MIPRIEIWCSNNLSTVAFECKWGAYAYALRYAVGSRIFFKGGPRLMWPSLILLRNGCEVVNGTSD